MIRILLLLVLVSGCAAQSETNSDVEGGVCLGLCYLIKISHDSETTTEEMPDD